MDPLTAVLIGAAIPLLGFIVVHRLNLSRERKSRLASACAAFRAAITFAASRVPEPEKHWENLVLDGMPQIVANIGTAVVQFKPFIQGKRRGEFEAEWLNLKAHIETQIPKALSPAEIMYGGGAAMARESKKKFHERVNRLLEFANEA